MARFNACVAFNPSSSFDLPFPWTKMIQTFLIAISPRGEDEDLPAVLLVLLMELDIMNEST
ncbi:hypothetical protein U9M48_033533 [Paspalum notatum var. saurae]|uniref:Uncharacterized protein n=1 Tax=Paspalum notatum var. saurae TaxID=547442 RepID=A0AAQ3U7Q2_PASNO